MASGKVSFLDFGDVKTRKLSLSNGVEVTFEFPNTETVFMVFITRTSVANTTAEGVFIGSTGTTNGHIKAIGDTPTNLAISISGKVLTMTSSTSNMRAVIMYA